MAFDWNGTFNKSQWERFIAFARAQMPQVKSRINHLHAEANRIGVLSISYGQDGRPVDLIVTPPGSYLAKLLAAYEVQGGNPFMDLRVRLRSAPIFAISGSETSPVQYMSSGDVIGAKGLADAVSSELIRDARSWLDDVLKARFGRIERKIRRAVDYGDELQNEISLLGRISSAVEVPRSLEQIVGEITALFENPDYRAIFDDKGKDPFGFTSYAPFSSYDVATPLDPNVKAREAETAQRQNSGFVGPGETGAG